MQVLEYSTDADVIRITIERSTFNATHLTQLNEYLQKFIAPSEQPTPVNASELRRLPPNERKRILAEQFARASELYKENPDALVEDTSDWGDIYAR